MNEINVTLRRVEDRSYDIIVGCRILRNLGETLRKRGMAGSLVIVTDSIVEKLWGQRILDGLQSSGICAEMMAFPAGEKSKKTEVVENLARGLVRKGADRKTILVALGGGVVGDISGFLASIFLRGVPYVGIPTTLLAQVDSSVGGKTGVDLPEGKNLLGTFYQPRFVFIDVSFLSTLPDEEFFNGLAEVIKYGVILDKEFFEFLETMRAKIVNRDEESLERIVSRCCALKRNVVVEDEKESGLRRILNFGHTIGHALEALSNYRLRHGHAIAIGMVTASYMATALGICPKEETERLEKVISSYNLPNRIPEKFSPGDIVKKLKYDKKRYGKKLTWVLPSKIGAVELVSQLSEKQITGVLEHLTPAMS